MKFIPPKGKTSISQNVFFNIFNPKVYTLGLIVFVFFAAMSVCTIGYSIGIFITDIIVLILLTIIIAFIGVSHSPHNVEIHPNRIDFNDYAYYIPNGLSFGTKRKIFVKIHCSVFNAEQFELKQNSIEKRFDIGHITFSGKLIVSCEEEFKLRNKGSNFSIYGIKNFSKFKEIFFIYDT